MPDVLIGDTEPATARLPLWYEKYGTNALAASVADTPSDSSAHAMREPSYAWMMSALPTTCCAYAPVSTDTVLVAPAVASDV